METEAINTNDSEDTYYYWKGLNTPDNWRDKLINDLEFCKEHGVTPRIVVEHETMKELAEIAASPGRLDVNADIVCNEDAVSDFRENNAQRPSP